MPIYDEQHTSNVGGHLRRRHPQEMKCLLDLAAKHKGPILELACGAGRITKELAKRGYEIYALDASEPMLKLAEQEIAKLTTEAQKNVHLIRGDMTNFEFGRKFPLVVIAYNSFWYNLEIDGAEKCLGQIINHLKRGGRFFIDTAIGWACLRLPVGDQLKFWDAQVKKYGFSLKYVSYGVRSQRTCSCEKNHEFDEFPCYLGLENFDDSSYYKAFTAAEIKKISKMNNWWLDDGAIIGRKI